MNSHMIKRKIYEEMKKEVVSMNSNISSNLSNISKQNVYSKHNLYKNRKRNIYK